MSITQTFASGSGLAGGQVLDLGALGHGPTSQIVVLGNPGCQFIAEIGEGVPTVIAYPDYLNFAMGAYVAQDEGGVYAGVNGRDDRMSITVRRRKYLGVLNPKDRPVYTGLGDIVEVTGIAFMLTLAIAALKIIPFGISQLIVTW